MFITTTLSKLGITYSGRIVYVLNTYVNKLLFYITCYSYLEYILVTINTQVLLKNFLLNH